LPADQFPARAAALLDQGLGDPSLSGMGTTMTLTL
jgi:hypothetical protein